MSRTLINVESVECGDGASAYEIDIAAALTALGTDTWVNSPFQYVVRIFNEEAAGALPASFIAADLVPAAVADLDFGSAWQAAGQASVTTLPQDYDAYRGVGNPYVRGAAAATCTITVEVLTGRAA